MSNNNTQQIQYFIQSRKKLNQVINDIMGNDSYIGSESDEDKMLTYNKKQSQPLVTRKGENDVHISLQQKNEKLNQENKILQLHNQLWIKLKQFLHVTPYFINNLNAVQGKATDQVLLEEFFQLVKDLIKENGSISSKKTEHHVTELLAEAKKKSIEDGKTIQRLKFENEKLRMDKELLEENVKILKQMRKQSNHEVGFGIQDKSSRLEEELKSLKEEKDLLREQVKTLQQRLLRQSTKGNLTQIKKSFQIEGQRFPSIQSHLTQTEHKNNKLKQILGIAQQMNTQFLQYLQSSIQPDKKEQIFPQFYPPKFQNKHFAIIKNRKKNIK